MSRIINQWIKPIFLFLFGIGMIVWGYVANATPKGKVTEEKDLVKSDPVADEPAPVAEATGTTTPPAAEVPAEQPAEPKKQTSNAGKTTAKEVKKEAAPQKQAEKVKEETKAEETPQEAPKVIIETEKKAEEATPTI